MTTPRRHLERSETFLRRSSSKIITQRIRHRYCCITDPFKGETAVEEDDDFLIEIPPQNSGRIRSNNGKLEIDFNEVNVDIEEGDEGIRIQVDGIDDVSDEEFRNRSNEAKKLCRQYTYTFFVLEKFSDGVEASAAIFAALVANWNLKLSQVMWICLVMFIVTVLDSLGDWGRLREKYARLHHLFSNLANSRESNRFTNFRAYAKSFGNDELFIDAIVLGSDTTGDT